MSSSTTSSTDKKIEERLHELEHKEKKWKELNEIMDKHAEKAKTKVVFDVGGKIFATTKDTLLSQPDTFFTAMMRSGRWCPDADGSYFIDRDPTYFGMIINYLRTGRFVFD
eukprot:TRINITY_DN5808_c0_g1_i5.p1 TRINITY_DN5808_c0_g1~~TRINITY_DN5808_c0_g1_i5.p1  ORF type:complete len:111 (+),score=33.09 TRINITY_DN5808_c0_g1_i5:36-368(+)